MAAFRLSRQLNQELILDISWFNSSETHIRANRRLGILDFPNVNQSIAKIESQETFRGLFKMRVLNLNKITQMFLGFFTEKNARYGEKWKIFHTIIGDFESLDFLPESSEVKKLLIFPTTKSMKFLDLERELLSSLDPIVAVHIRLTDYVNLSEIYGVLSQNYYSRSKEISERHFRRPKYWLFSDDAATAKKEYSSVFDFSRVVGPDDLVEEIEVLELMSLCHGIITANSTFSWWAGYLATINRQDAFVCAPRHYKNFEKTDPYSAGLHVKNWRIVDN